MKICENKECKATNPQPEENFELMKDGKYSWRRGKCKACRFLARKKWGEENREKFNAYMRDYNAVNKHTKKWKDRYKNRSLKQRYGITLAQFDQMVLDQNNTCLICLRERAQLRKNLVIDHCHDSGKVRGALCYRCNRLMVLLDKTPDLLRRAIAYKKKNSSNTDPDPYSF